ncbi:host attachment protein [Novosphingobium sp. KCTC 2891]|uniref:host attachment protein n=1 Tax=Novosphingobium sp. KCTC 2891 TaxID=2989730 RepID=UPI00222203CE|nr:host attachment protein [Novosphingobium sp. KCTC 2891]MCW1383350.1 host attachment protein [Novosphingobium sp. KCTC 2891]
MLLPHGAVIALVDGENWTLLRNAGNEATPDLAELPTPHIDEHNHSGSGGRHGPTASNPSPRQMHEDAHAGAVAEWLNQQVIGHKIEHLVVIAPPRTLGELRHHYAKQVSQVLLGEVAKDLIGRKPDEVLAALRGK